MRAHMPVLCFPDVLPPCGRSEPRPDSASVVADTPGRTCSGPLFAVLCASGRQKADGRRAAGDAAAAVRQPRRGGRFAVRAAAVGVGRGGRLQRRVRGRAAGAAARVRVSFRKLPGGRRLRGRAQAAEAAAARVQHAALQPHAVAGGRVGRVRGGGHAGARGGVRAGGGGRLAGKGGRGGVPGGARPVHHSRCVGAPPAFSCESGDCYRGNCTESGAYCEVCALLRVPRACSF